MRVCLAGGSVAWGPNVVASERIQPEMRREALLDHYHQHTGQAESSILSVLLCQLRVLAAP